MEAARGGRDIETIQPADRTNRATKIDRAAARKRILYARYTGWAQGTKRHPQGLIGPAGETATRSAIVASGSLQPLTPGAAETASVLGVTLSGPVDSAGFMVPVLRGGIPGQPVTTIFEVKNIRSWIYPSAAELYQVLAKGVELQAAHPSQPILPVLVCRRAHQTTFWMAKQLGFMVIDMGRQFAGTAMTEDEVLEVRNELDFNDLYRGDGPSARVLDRLRDTIPGECADAAARWAQSTVDLGTYFTSLKQRMPSKQRHLIVDQLREASKARGDRGGW